MNNLQPYEKHLAERLQQVPVPDKHEGWEEMRKLLDRELPEGGGGWSGNRKWWWMGITVAIIISGVWLSQQLSEQKKDTSLTTLNASNEKAGTNSIRPEQPGDLSSKKNNAEAERPGADVASSRVTGNQVSKSIDKNKSPENSESRKNSEEKIVVDLPSAANNNFHPKDRTSTNNTSGETNQFTIKPNANQSRSIKRDRPATKGSGVILTANALQTESGSVDMGKSPKSIFSRFFSDSFDEGATTTHEATEITGSTVKPPIDAEPLFQTPSEYFTSFELLHDPLKAQLGKTDKVFAKEMRKKSIKDDTRKISGKSMRGIGTEQDHELTFAAGLSLPQSFAIGSQQSPSYGVNAKPGTISDYLPVPFFQYHMNNRLFFQTELQFQTPQFTDRLLISQSKYAIAPTNGVLEKNIFVEKLYYFHIPFNVYFSPVKNLYLGSGLQFSSLISGVATYQDNRYTNGTLENSSSRVQAFKDDSVAAKLAPNEWRYQFEANYYIKRMTLGARYNQALNEFVNLQPSAGLPYTQGRNQSFLIYLKYNIWEERKKQY